VPHVSRISGARGTAAWFVRSASLTAGPVFWLSQNTLLWQRWLIVSAVLAASAYLGPRGSFADAVIVALIVVCVLFLRRPQLGLCALVGLTLSVPFSIGTGTESSINVTVLFIGLLTAFWLLQMVVEHNVRLVSSSVVPPLVAFLGVSAIAFVAGTRSWLVFAQTAPIAAQIGGFSIFVLSGLVFLIVAHWAQDVRWLRWMVWTFFVVGSVHIADLVLPFAHTGLSDAMMGHTLLGSMFWTWFVALAFSQAVFNRELALPVRAALAGGVAATVGYALLTSLSWTSGWLPPLVAIVVTVWVASPRRGIFVLLLGVVVLIPKMTDFASALLFNNEKNQYDILTRTAAWQIMGELIKLDPIFGTGFANYYHYTPLYPILGYAVQFNSHNNYLDILVQTGFLGMLCFVWFVLRLGWIGWGLRNRIRDGFSQAYVYGALGGLVASLVAAGLGDWVLPFVYNIGLRGFKVSVLAWIFLGGLVALEQMARRADSAEASA
jgi:O-antigen ligase